MLKEEEIKKQTLAMSYFRFQRDGGGGAVLLLKTSPILVSQLFWNSNNVPPIQAGPAEPSAAPGPAPRPSGQDEIWRSAGSEMDPSPGPGTFRKLSHLLSCSVLSGILHLCSTRAQCSRGQERHTSFSPFTGLPLRASKLRS